MDLVSRTGAVLRGIRIVLFMAELGEELKRFLDENSIKPGLESYRR